MDSVYFAHKYHFGSVYVVERKYFTCPEGRGSGPPVGAIVVERKYFTCPSRESNPGRWIYRQTLYHVAVKAGFYRKAVEVL